MPPMFWALLAGGLIASISFGWFFHGWKDFWIALKSSMRPDLFSWLAGELQEDWRNTFRVQTWLVIILMVARLVYQLASWWSR